MPFLRNVTAGRNVPDERLAAGGRALLPVRRGQPDQPAVPRPAGRDREGLRRGAASTCRCTGATGTGSPTWPTRWRPWRPTACAAALAFVHVRLQLLLQLPAVPGGHRPGPRRGRRGAPRVDKITPYFGHPGFAGRSRTATRRRWLAAGRGPRRRRPGLHRAQHPAAMSAQRPGRRRLPRPAGRGGRAGRRAAGGTAGRGGWPTQPQRAAVRAVAGAGRQRLPGRAGPAGRTRRGRGADRVRLRPHGGPVRPGRGGRADRWRAARACRSPGRPTPGTSPPFVAMITDLVRDRGVPPAGPPRSARRARRPRGAGACCREPAAAAAAAAPRSRRAAQAAR